MKATCKAKDLYNALYCCNLGGKSPHLPVLANALVKAQDNVLLIMSTNLDTIIETKVSAEVQEDSAILLPTKTVLQFLRKEKENVELISSKASLRLKVSNAKLEIPHLGQSPEDYPPLPQIPLVEYEMPHDFKRSLMTARDFVSSESYRPILTGILFHSNKGQLNLVAADGFRICIIKVAAVLPDIELCIPNITAYYIHQYLAGTIKLGYDKDYIIFNDGIHTIASRLIQGTYPRYMYLVPTAIPTMTVKCSGALVQHRCEQSQATIIRMRKHSDVALALDTHGLGLSDIFQAIIQAEITGDGKVACSRDYLQRLSRYFVEMNMEITTSSSPIKITNEDGSLIVIVMPMFVQW